MSDRFRFRLGRLLALREKAQDRAAIALAQSLDAAARIDAEKGRAADVALAARLRQLSDEGDAHRHGEAAALQWLSECADARVEALAQELDQAQRDAEQRRHDLLLRTKERRVLERLRERQVDAWREATGRRTQQQMDDVALRITTDRNQDDQP